MAFPQCGPVKHFNPAKASRYGNAVAMHACMLACMHARTLKIVSYAAPLASLTVHVHGTSEVPSRKKPRGCR